MYKTKYSLNHPDLETCNQQILLSHNLPLLLYSTLLPCSSPHHTPFLLCSPHPPCCAIYALFPSPNPKPLNWVLLHFQILLLLLSSMASLPFSSLFLAISMTLLVSLFSRVHALTCNSQKLPKNRVFPNCTDLPTLGATLHYNYDASNSSLAVAYIAEPAKPDGWVAWGINPTRPGMLGTQALIAFKLNGKVTVQTYNLTSYKGITQTKLSFDVWDLAAEENDGKITILATVKVPEKVESLNQVWQVGPSVTGGMPDKHEFAAANLKAAGLLQVVGNAAENNGSGSGNATSGGGGGGKSGGVSLMGERFGLGFYLGLFLFLLGCFSF